MKVNLDLAKKVFETEAQAIMALKERLDESFVKAVELITQCDGKIVFTGIGKSGIIARKIASTMSSTGTPAIFLHPSESSHGDLGLVEARDVVVAISYGGGTVELASILSFVTRKGIPLIAMTGNKDSDLAKRAKYVLDVKINKEACPLGLAPTTSSTATLAMGDALAMCVLERKGFTAEDFAEVHPGGGLGFKLAKIKELMHTGASLPILTQQDPMRKVLSVLSQGEVRGAVVVVDDNGDLLGIITDGQIRRRLEKENEDSLGLTAKDLMTLNPKVVDANEIAEKALFLMEEFRVNVLFVLDKDSSHPRKPIGVIHIQDLIKSKLR